MTVFNRLKNKYGNLHLLILYVELSLLVLFLKQLLFKNSSLESVLTNNFLQLTNSPSTKKEHQEFTLTKQLDLLINKSKTKTGSQVQVLTILGRLASNLNKCLDQLSKFWSEKKKNLFLVLKVQLKVEVKMQEDIEHSINRLLDKN